MNQTILQIPISKTLKAQAEAVARRSGSSLEEMLRKLITKFARRELDIDQQQAKKTAKYSPQLYADVERAKEWHRKGKGKTYTNVKDLRVYLDSLK